MSELLTEIVNRCGPLWTSNTGLWTMTCPYCGDKTEQFQVNEKRDVYHCFACHKGGGVMHIKRDFMPLHKH